METKKRIRQPSIYDELTEDELVTLSNWQQEQSFIVLAKVIRAKRDNNLRKLLLVDLNEASLIALAEIQGANREDATILSIPAKAQEVLRNRSKEEPKGKYKDLYLKKRKQDGK